MSACFMTFFFFLVPERADGSAQRVSSLSLELLSESGEVQRSVLGRLSKIVRLDGTCCQTCCFQAAQTFAVPASNSSHAR